MSLRQIAVLIVLHRSFRGGGEAKRRGLAWREAREVEAVTGKGLRAEFEGQKVAIGNVKLFDGEPIPNAIQQQVERLQTEGKSIMLIQADGQFLGVVALADPA